MKTLSEDVRLFIEKQFDHFYSEPDEWLEAANRVLSEQGIEPGLENILSYLVGMTLGEVSEFIKNKFNRAWTNEEARAISELMARRALEIRQQFLATKLR